MLVLCLYHAWGRPSEWTMHRFDSPAQMISHFQAAGVELERYLPRCNTRVW